MASPNTSVVRQGCKTSTVLINCSNYITIIDDENLKSKNSCCKFDSNSLLPPKPIKMGTRKMHRSSLKLGQWSGVSPPMSTTRKEFSGRTDLEPSRRPAQYPSQHWNHFLIGDGKQDHFDAKRFSFATTKIPVKHEHKDIWRKQMNGSNMIHSLSYNMYKPSFSTTSQDVHRRIACQPSQNITDNSFPSSTFDRIANMDPTKKDAEYRRTSGNKVLHEIRKNQTSSVLN